MTQTDQAGLAYGARRDVSPQWRPFLAALLETLDQHLDRASRDALLRAVGTRLAASLPLPPAGTLEELELRMNQALAATAWGYVRLALDPEDRTLRLTHSAAPCIAAAGDDAGAWLGPVLEGLHGAWLAAQPGGEAAGGASMRLVALQPGLARLRYGG